MTEPIEAPLAHWEDVLLNPDEEQRRRLTDWARDELMIAPALHRMRDQQRRMEYTIDSYDSIIGQPRQTEVAEPVPEVPIAPTVSQESQLLAEFKAQALKALCDEANRRGWCSDFNDMLIDRGFFDADEIAEARQPSYTHRIVIDIVTPRENGDVIAESIRDGIYGVEARRIRVTRRASAQGNSLPEEFNV